jgi:antitoxin component of MazEF toxin-antitoxin module
VTPSATSRKAVPAVFARKRARTAAFGDEQDELEEVQINPSMSEQEQIEAKRRQNTIAARRSRKRKLEYQRELEESVEQYKRESEIWKARAMTCQALLRSHTIECPEFPDP